MSIEWFKGTITPEQAEINKKITDTLLGDKAKLFEMFQIIPVIAHWSRIWEFSWVVSHMKLPAAVLDAGGGASPLSLYLSSVGYEIYNLDLEQRGFYEMSKWAPNAKWVQGDIKKLPFEDGQFDYVVNTSVLEHIENPLTAVKELKRVCKGKLLITMDITTNARWNHTVDETVAKDILNYLELEWVEPHGAKAIRFQEHDREGKPEEGSVISRVLGLMTK